MTHPDLRELIEYVSGQGPEELRIRIDSHVADCPQCLKTVQGSLLLRRDFEAVWESWTPQEHGRALEDAARSPALKARPAASVVPDPDVLDKRVLEQASRSALPQRVIALLSQIAGDTRLTLKLLLSQARQVASAAAGLIPPGHVFALSPAFAGTGAAGDELQTHLNKGSELLAQDQPEQAMQELLAAVQIDARSPQTAVTSVLREGAPFLQVVVDGHRGHIWAKCSAKPDQSAPAVAVLIPEEQNIDVRFAEFKTLEDEPGLLADFEDVQDGTYRLAVGPMS